MSDISTIDSLLNPQGDDNDEGVGAKLARKQGEIKNKEIEKETERLAQDAGLAYVNLSGFPISPEALALIDIEEAQEIRAACFFYNGKAIRLAFTEYTMATKAVAEELEARYFCEVKLYLVSDNSFNYVLEAYKSLPKNKKIDTGVEIKEADLDKFKEELSSYKSLNDKISTVNISDIVTLLLATAIKVGASDIHIEAEENGVVIRLRIDGVLQEAALIDRSKWKKIISRLKIVAHVKLNVEKKPQDGRFSIFLKNKQIEVRSSFLPTAYGESVVMRLLDPATLPLDLKSLGLREQSLQILEKELAKPNGLILTTGPTGSGKTTTLYAILRQLNQPGVKIITLEDPIEYQLPNINQSQVDASRGYTFDSGLRSILRQDPNVVMVGEVRDLETAEISVQASLTGHVVLTTLHTNDAAGVIPRLLDIGVKPYFLIPAINAVIGQRLARRLCPHCREEHKLTETEEEQIKKILAVISPKANIKIAPQLPTIYQANPAGCAECNYLGYKGQIGLYEIFSMADNIKELTATGAPAFQILRQAVENGMLTILQDGILKCLEGITSISEVYRVSGNFDYVNELYDIVISQTIGRGLKISPSQMSQIDRLSADLKAVPAALNDLSSKELLEMTMGLAAQINAGDVHIEPEESSVKIRFRIDGVMQDVADIPKESYLPLLAEIKILAGFETNVKKATWDGRFAIFLPEHKIDCRLSIIIGGRGETVVIRLLNNTAASLKLSDLGVSSVTLKALEAALKKTRGIIITTGPTGSGKTTTLYAALNTINTPDTKIITVEDPIEYELPGLIQTQIDPARGYTFAAAIRSLLRQNPNIMMIGEIRDEETAKIALEAALTGHLVLSTIHANSAAGAISRFSGLGLDRKILANALEFAVSQRLVRRLCPHCRIPYEIDDTFKTKIEEIFSKLNNAEVKKPETTSYYKAVGCKQCGGLGYKGRVGLYEGISCTEPIQKLINNDDITDSEIETAAVKEGMVTMAQDGIIKASEGLTSLEEVFRVI